MHNSKSTRILLLVLVACLVGCEPEGDVEILPLPPLDRPSPEQRYGLPEVAGRWRFAGWEIVRGDSTALERTFPSFGELVIETQRLDSIAGTFMLGGGSTPIVGEVRQEGDVALVTYRDGVPGRFIAGTYERDTLWLELTSILEADEWPRDARAAFVRTPVAEPIAWLRGAHPNDLARQRADSIAAAGAAAGAPAPAVGAPIGGAAPVIEGPPAGGGAAGGPSVPTRSGRAAPPRAQPGPSRAPVPEPDVRPRARPEPQPERQPERQPQPPPEREAEPPSRPEPEVPEAEPDFPVLLGEPVVPDNP